MSTTSASDPATPARLVYLLYLAGLLLHPLLLIGVIIAYVYRSDAPAWLNSHYRYQIRSFWIGLFYLLAGVLLSIFLVGYLLILWWFLWLAIRCIKGLKALGEKRPLPAPDSWLF